MYICCALDIKVVSSLMVFVYFTHRDTIEETTWKYRNYDVKTVLKRGWSESVLKGSNFRLEKIKLRGINDLNDYYIDNVFIGGSGTDLDTNCKCVLIGDVVYPLNSNGYETSLTVCSFWGRVGMEIFWQNWLSF